MIKKGDYLTIEQVTEILPISRTGLYELKKRHPEVMKKLGRRVLIDMREIEKLLGRREEE